MGAFPSTDAPGGARSAGATQTNHYELLGVDRQASEEEIKKAYRRKALDLHPDRNLDAVEEATRLFAEIQAAYEVLSDPQQRAWYDSQREVVWRHDGYQFEAGDRQKADAVHGTSAADIFRVLAAIHGRVQYSDAPDGFFAVIRSTFDTIAQEERAAYEADGLAPVTYPAFGAAQASYEDVVRPFYAVWIGFATRRDFAWKEAAWIHAGQDRRMRRWLEKENKRLRDEGIREYNEVVRDLVALARSRDPRYIPNTQTEAERQKALRDAAAAQAARSRAANQAKFQQDVRPEWSKVQVQESEGDGDREKEPEPEHVFECVACAKTFKSEKQFEEHEKSRKHVKAVQQLQRRMQKEDKALGLDAVAADGVANSASPLGSDDDEYASREKVEIRLNGIDSRRLSPTSDLEPALEEGVKGRTEDDAADSSLQDTEHTAPAPKVGRARQKRAKKSAQPAKASVAGGEFECATCQETFPSKTKLFDHIRQLDHAQPVAAPAPKGNKKRRR
ncbi:MAG: hypothetical protein M1826_006373 [Phylliscum demangeonii]|nr:MAG: hypothetical protein M1826_006373 [Phylliscum demangeonii]